MFKTTKFEKAKPIWIKNHEKEMNRTVIFEASAPRGNDTVISITAQNDYQLFINGKFVFHGPARAGHGFFRVDKLNIEKYLDEDINKITVLVCAYHCENFYLINQQAFLCAELTDNGKCFLATGTDDWNAYLYTQKLQKVERYAFQRPFCEVYDFTCAEPLQAVGVKQELVTYDIDTFIEREVSYPDFPIELKKSYIECGKVLFNDTPKPFSTWWSDKIGKQYPGFSNEEIEFSSSDLVQGLCLEKSEALPTDKIASDSYETLEMSCNLTGLVLTELYCEKDTTLILTFDEILTDKKVDYARMECVNAVVYKLKGKKQYRLITAEPYTFKYMNVISLGSEITVDKIGVIRTDFNESEIIKRVKPDADEQIKRIYNAAEQTFRQNTYDIYMDCPSRERAGWLCDSFFTSRVEHFMTGKSTVEKSFLSNFVMGGQYSPIPQGMLPMCYPADHVDGNFIPNWAMWYVIELKEYCKRTGDVSFIKALKKRLYALLDYFRTLENERGLLCRLKGWVFVEWSECNNLCQDINYPTNMLYHMFKNTLGELYDDNTLIKEAELLRETIRKESRIGMFFCDNALLDGNNKATLSGKITETCQYYAFFTGVATKDEDSELWQTLVSDFGSERKKNNKWKDVYFSNAFIGNYLRLDLLKTAGLKNELEADIRGYFDYMAKETGTL